MQKFDKRSLMFRNSIPGKSITGKTRPGSRICQFYERKYSSVIIDEKGNKLCPKCGHIINDEKSQKGKAISRG